MKKYIVHLLFATVLVAVTTSCARLNSSVTHVDPESYGALAKQSRQSGDVVSIDAARGVTVIYRQSDELSLEVSAPEDMLQYVETTISKGKLTATISKEIRNVNFPAVVTVTSPLVTDFDVSSGAQIQVDSLSAASSKVEIEASSGASFSFSRVVAGTISLDLSSGAVGAIAVKQADKVDAEASSGAALTISGNATAGKFEASSGAAVNASGLAVKSADAEASSGASISCNAESMTRCKATSGGVINNK